LVLILLKEILQRRVLNNATVPIIFPLNLNGGKSRRQSSGRHNMLRAYSLLVGIKVYEISGTYIDGADAESLAAVIQEIKIDELFERVAQCCRIIMTGRAVSAGQMEPRIGHARLKKKPVAQKAWSRANLFDCANREKCRPRAYRPRSCARKL
jgi:hypothetical protein